MTQINIEITSDTVCPWCYVGKRQLDRAIETWKQKYPERKDVFNISWKPFYLNPDAPKKGIDKTAYYQQKFGAARTEQIFARLSSIGAPLSINFKYGGKIGNTRDSHRLITLSSSISPTSQSAVVSSLFKAYFEEEKDITDHEVLIEAGVRAGLEEGVVRVWLEGGGDQGGEVVDREVEGARRRGLSGVPDFLVGGVFEVGGAQDSEVFVGVFERVVAKG